MENNTRSKSCQDISTIVAIAIVAWALFAVLHEIVGHGGAAFFLGEKVLGAVSTTVHIMDFYDLSHVVDRIGWWGFRVVAAAGTAVNLATGALALLLLKFGRVTRASNRYFLWFFATISIMQQAFWLAVMPIAGLGGDWTAFFIEMNNAVIWKWAVTGAGILLLLIGYHVPLSIWNPTLEGSRHEKRKQAMRLTVVPIGAAFVLQMLSVIWSPLEGGRHTTIVSVVSFFPLLLWLIPVNLIRWPEPTTASEADCFNRSNAWLVAGSIVLILFVFVLGTGIGSFDGHPDNSG